jgi:hypothetical protein
MIGYLPEHAAEFMELFARLEHALRRNGYARTDQERAVVNWRRFALDLGEKFFLEVCRAQKAQTLIGEPPRVYIRGRGMQPEVQRPITDVVELFSRGVCQVRNNIVHGEKYVDLATPRDDALVREAHWLLLQAIARHPHAGKLLTQRQAAN